MYRPMWPFLLMYGSHDMRHIGFRRLTVVNGTPGNWGVTALDQHLTIRSSTFICEGGGQRFELNRVSIHVLLSDRALIDTVTF